MAYRISNYEPRQIVLNEQDETQSIMQNIWILLNTWAGSVPLYREFGYDPTVLHKPVNMVETLMVGDLTNKIEEYEPRVEVAGIYFSVQNDKPDRLGVTVEVEVIDEDGS